MKRKKEEKEKLPGIKPEADSEAAALIKEVWGEGDVLYGEEKPKKIFRVVRVNDKGMILGTRGNEEKL